MVPTRRDVAPDEVERLLADLFPATWLRETAQEVGFVRRSARSIRSRSFGS